MSSFLYFAYGSNMLNARLQARCPTAKPIGIAFAAGYTLTFSKPSIDGSGKGNLTPTRKRYRQPGVLFEIDSDDRNALDRAEGLGQGYDRHDAFQVSRADNREVVGSTVYLASAPKSDLVPYDWYLALIIAGARQHRFDRRRMRQLLAVDFKPHTDSPGGGRDEAIALLRAEGIDNDLQAFFKSQAELARPRIHRSRQS